MHASLPYRFLQVILQRQLLQSLLKDIQLLHGRQDIYIPVSPEFIDCKRICIL